MNENKQAPAEEQGEKARKKRSARFYIILILAIALLAVAGILGGRWIYQATHIEAAFAADFASATPTEVMVTPSPTATPSPSATAETVTQTPTPEPTLSPEELLAQESDPEFLKKRVNILLLGLDRSKEREKWGSFRTDTMVLVSVNLDDKQVSMISIPRDSFVKIHNKKARAKINSAFGVGRGADKNGYEYAMKTVSNLFGGVPIDYYVGFDMQLVKDVVDVIGGVDYDVDVEIRMNGRELHPGPQKLDGQAVLDYCRQRKGSSDIARVDRQQRMLLAVFDELKSSEQILNVPKIYAAVMDNMDTNLSLQQISSLALFANDIGLSNIQRYTVEGDYLTMYETSYWGISNSKLKKLVQEVFGKRISPNPEDDVYYIKARYEEEMAALSAQEAALQNPEEMLGEEGLPEELPAEMSGTLPAEEGEPAVREEMPAEQAVEDFGEGEDPTVDIPLEEENAA